MICIICDKENTSKAIEHIVSESFGNKDYVLERGAVCDECNNRFSEFEAKAMNNSVFIMERARFGIATKKGAFAKGRIDKIKINGDKYFKKDLLNLYGLSEEDVEGFNPATGEFRIKISSFSKSEVATSKLLLKMGIESLYKSQKVIFEKFDFSELKNFLTNKERKDWPFLVTDHELDKFNWVPRFSDKYKLKAIRCELKYCISNNDLLFKFKYGAISMLINLCDRNLNWMKPYVIDEAKTSIHPDHFRKYLIPKK